MNKKYKIIILTFLPVLFAVFVFAKHINSSKKTLVDHSQLQSVELRPDVDQNLINNPEAQLLFSKFNSTDDKVIIQNLIAYYAKNVQLTLDNYEDKEMIIKLYKESGVINKCAATLYGIDGIKAVFNGYKLTVNNTERKLISLKSGKHLAFKLIESPVVSKEECRKEFLR